MGLISKLFGKKEETTFTEKDFWAWFVKNEKKFHAILSSKENIEDGFLDPFHEQLLLLNTELFFLAGMYADDIAELIITADGSVRKIFFVEELIRLAPVLPNWKFTSLKQAEVGSSINTGGYEFSSEKLSFYANEHKEYPDLI